MKWGRTLRHWIPSWRTNNKEKEFLTLPFLKPELLLTTPVEQHTHDPIPHSISGFSRRKPGILGFLSPKRCPLLTCPATGHTTIHALYHSPSRSKGRHFSKPSVFQEWKDNTRFTHKFLLGVAKRRVGKAGAFLVGEVPSESSTYPMPVLPQLALNISF